MDSELKGQLKGNFQALKTIKQGQWYAPVQADGTLLPKIMVKNRNIDVEKVTDKNVICVSAHIHGRDELKASKVLSEQGLIIPSAVLASFACEILYKSLIYGYDLNATGHKLSNLHKQLKDEDKEEVACKIKEAGYEHFEKSLEEFSSTFEKLRYFHEYEAVKFDLSFLIGLADVLASISEMKLIKTGVSLDIPVLADIKN